jgi:hypothetical protein
MPGEAQVVQGVCVAFAPVRPTFADAAFVAVAHWRSSTFRAVR